MTNENEILQIVSEVKNDQNKIKTLLLSQKSALNLVELCEYTGFSKSFLYKELMGHRVPGAYKPTGKHYFFDRKEIDRWLLSNKAVTD